MPVAVSGVPPDYFSKTGQLWGHPVYRWDILKASGFDWWVRRIEHNLKHFDYARIDHFRGLVAYWEVPATEKSAINGKWIEAPASDLFDCLVRRFPVLPIIAEDLGLITDDVKETLDHFGFPGMRVLLFAFDDDILTNPYIPENYVENCVAYTGTHDTNTVKGWFEKEASLKHRERLFRYLGRNVRADELPWELIRLLLNSVADMVILPMQDLLGLGEEGRMNRPSIREGNWEWRLSPRQLTPALTEKILELTVISGRNAKPSC